MIDANKIILVVEDEPTYQRTLAEKLSHEGFTVISAKDGKEGLLLALERHPDLILLDLQMPKMGGIEMAKRLRMDEWGKNAKVIILSNYSDVNKTEQALENEIFNYFVKADIKLGDLVQKVKDFTK